MAKRALDDDYTLARRGRVGSGGEVEIFNPQVSSQLDKTNN